MGAINYLTWERQQRIIELLETQGVVQVARLAKLFGVSELTIRRDLNQLVQYRNVERVHGGAVLTTPDRSAVPSSMQGEAVPTEVGRVAERAFQLIQPGQTILLGAGEASTELARLLTRQRGLKVITSSLPIAMVLAGAPELQLLVTGGLYNSRSQSLLGHFAEHTIGQLHADLCFLTPSAFSVKAGITSDEVHEVAHYRAAVSASDKVVVLVDQSTAGRKLTYSVIRPESVHIVIAGEEVPASFGDEIQKLGVDFIRP